MIPIAMPTLLKLKRWSWYGFEIGNHAHALMVSTVGFALYFRQYLFADNPRADSMWGLLTAIVLAISALVSPFFTSWLSLRNLRWLGLFLTTIACVAATLALGTDSSAWTAVVFYVVSALGYYVALPIYTTYINEVSGDRMDQVSARGWAYGYVGGLLVALIAFKLGLLSHPVRERPDLFRDIFLLAGLFNLAFSLPMLLWTAVSEIRTPLPRIDVLRWNPRRVLDIFSEAPTLFRLLCSYWMIGECATITIYFTAIFLAQYAHMNAGRIFEMTLLVQLIATFSTWFAGDLAVRYGPKCVYRGVCVLWISVPIFLFLISVGVTYWIAMVLIGLVLGVHHAIIRSEVAKITTISFHNIESRGSVFGFLEVAGRITSVFGPLLVALVGWFLPLSYTLLVACIFPILALIFISKYKWIQSAY